MNSRIPIDPPSGKARGKKANFAVAAYFGSTVRNFKGESVVLEGEPTDLPTLIITALKSIQEKNNFPDGVTRIEVACELVG